MISAALRHGLVGLACAFFFAEPALAQSENSDDVPAENRVESAPKNSSNRKSGRGLIIGQPDLGYEPSINISPLFSLGSVEDFFGIGFGGLVGFPIVPNGFIPSLNDAFYIEAGLFVDVGFTSFDEFFFVTPLGGVRWDFQLLEPITVYASLRTGASFGEFGEFYVGSSVGAFWRPTQVFSVRVEFVGSTLGANVNAGVGFWF